jgi:hypothetical protein
MTPPRPVYRLTLEALPDDVPAHVRLKRVLKGLLRGYGFRCVRVEQVPPASGVAGRHTMDGPTDQGAGARTTPAP